MSTQKYLVPCIICGLKVHRAPSRVKLQKNVFCSRKCYGRHRAEHKDEYFDGLALCQTSESRQKAMETRSARWASGELVHGRLGKKHSAETKQKMSERKLLNLPVGSKNGMFERGHTEESKQKMSETRTRKMLSGEIKSHSTGHLNGIHLSTKTGVSYHFRSSWEQKMMSYLDLNSEVSSYTYEDIRIPYFLRNRKRWYIPDFIVTYTSGRRSMYELKPKEFVNNEKTLLKAVAAQAWCQNEGINEYRILTRDELIQMGVLT